MLYLHGWNDYFFQTHVADYLTDLGYDFYAVELRRYGRSLRPRATPGLHHRSRRLRRSSLTPPPT